MPFKSSGRGAYGPQGQKVIKGPLAPVWTTFSPPAGGASAYSYQFVATDDSGDAPTYSLASGSIPTGLTLSSAGLLSGTCTASGTFTFNVRATDVNGRFTDSGNVSVVVSLSLYSFSSFTFTAAGAGGRQGPSLAQLNSAYSAQPFANNTNLLAMDINGIQRWKVPSGGTYRILAVGAPGGKACDNGQGWGSGTSMQGDFTLATGAWLNIMVGQRGLNDPAYSNPGAGGTRMSAGGGGGSGVWLDAAVEPLIIAGGGGGSSDQPEAFRTGRHSQNDASTGTSGQNGRTDSGNRSGANGGSGGSGGSVPCANSANSAGGGGGFKSAGGNCGAEGGHRLQTDGYGGLANGGDGSRNGNGGQNMHGGFGGGGGPGGWYGCSGGGGGYSGGGAGDDNDRTAGGGGGSYNAGSNQVNSLLATNQTGHGYVTITKL